MNPTPIDFAIITTLDIEFDAVCAHLENPQRIDQSKDAVVYFRGKVQIPQTSAAYDVVVCQILQMGNVESALATENLLGHWEPQAIILVGIAGGRQGKVNLGDIVVSKKVVYYERGKLLDDSTQYRPEEYPVHPFLWNKAKFYSDTAWHNRIGVPPPYNHDQLLNVRLGTIASGEHVVDSATLMAALASEVHDLSAVAMEGAGVAAAILRRGPNAGAFLEVRGISDLANGTKDDTWQQFAAKAAAAYVGGFLSSGPLDPIEQLPNQSPKQSIDAIRMQSLRPVNPAGVHELLSRSGLTANDVLLDFTDLVLESDLHSPELAIARLLGEDGPLSRVVGSSSASEVAAYGQIHVPIAAAAGYFVSDRIPIRLFDFHPNELMPNWNWPSSDDKPYPELLSSSLPELAVSTPVFIRVSISYLVQKRLVSSLVRGPIGDMDIGLQTPAIGVVRSEAQVHAYARAFRRKLDELASAIVPPSVIHVCYAGPVSLAFAMGQAVSATIHPPVVFWNFRRGAYDWGINLAAAIEGTNSVITSISLTKAPL